MIQYMLHTGWDIGKVQKLMPHGQTTFWDTRCVVMLHHAACVFVSAMSCGAGYQ